MNVTDNQTDDGRTRSRLLNTQRFDFKMINTAGLGDTFIIYRRLHKNYLHWGWGEHD